MGRASILNLAGGSTERIPNRDFFPVSIPPTFDLRSNCRISPLKAERRAAQLRIETGLCIGHTHLVVSPRGCGLVADETSGRARVQRKTWDIACNRLGHAKPIASNSI